MTTNERINQLMDMLDNPQAYSEEEIRDLINSDEETKDFYRTMVEAKQSYRRTKAEQQPIDTDEGWQRFQQRLRVGERSSGMQNLQGKEPRIISMSGSIRKYAAVIAGVLLISGLSYAAILQIRQRNEAKQAQEIVAEAPEKISSPATTDKEEPVDTLQPQPKTFDNVPLVDILPEIAEYYGMKAEFRNHEAESIRLFFTWNPQETVDKAITKLNQFERLSVKREGENIIVE